MSAKRESLRSPKRLAALMRRRIPFALDPTRHPVLPNGPGGSEQGPAMPTAAQSTERYLCPDCLEPVRLDQKGGEAHFVHDQPEECRLEGPGWMRHSGTLAAYVQVRMAIEGSAQMPRLSRTCGQCGSTGWQGLPADLTNVDVTCHDQRGHVEDILLFRGPQAACSVVLVEHVPSDLDDLASRARSKALLVLRADEVLLDPASWRPAWEAGLRDWRCEGCR